MTEQQFATLIAVLGRIAQALEAQAEPEDEKLTFPLSDYATFDWAGIGATVIQRDGDGVSVIRAANGKMCKRRSNDKFGTEIWFSYCTGKGADGTPTYARVIEFRAVQPPEPLGRKTEQAVKAATTGKPAANPPAPSDPPSLYDRLMVAQRAIVGAGKVVPYYLMPSRDDSPAALERNVLALERLAAETLLPADVVEARHAIERLHNEAKSLDMQVDPAMTDLNGDVTLLGMRVSTLRRLIDAHRATIGRAVYPPTDQVPRGNGHGQTEGIAVKVEPPAPAAPVQTGIPLGGGPAAATAPESTALLALRDRLNELAAECNGRKQRAPGNARQDIAILLNTMCGNSEKRKQFLMAVAGRDRLEVIGDAMLCALFRWLKPARDGAHLVSASATAAAEIEAAMRQPEAPSS